MSAKTIHLLNMHNCIKLVRNAIPRAEADVPLPNKRLENTSKHSEIIPHHCDIGLDSWSLLSRMFRRKGAYAAKRVFTSRLRVRPTEPNRACIISPAPAASKHGREELARWSRMNLANFGRTWRDTMLPWRRAKKKDIKGLFPQKTNVYSYGTSAFGRK